MLLINVCEMESEDYLSFFDISQSSLPAQTKQALRSSAAFNNSIRFLVFITDSLYSNLLEELSMLIYEQVRPLILDVDQVEVLCDCVHMIKMEIIAGDVIKRSTFSIYYSDLLDSFSSVIIPVIIKLEEDIRERIIYKAHSYIESTIYNYPITKEDINYPTKLYGFSIHSTYYL